MEPQSWEVLGALCQAALANQYTRPLLTHWSLWKTDLVMTQTPLSTFMSMTKGETLSTQLSLSPLAPFSHLRQPHPPTQVLDTYTHRGGSVPAAHMAAPY